MTWLNGGTLAHENDVHVLRRHLARIDFLQAQLRDVAQQIAKTAARARFREGVQILQGFRGIALYTAMQRLCERGDFRRFPCQTALMAYLGLVPSQRSSGTTLRYGSITKNRQRARTQSAGQCSLEIPLLPQRQRSAATAALFGPNHSHQSAGATAVVPALSDTETTQSPNGRSHSHRP